jgi:hypothetical protein
LLTPEEQSYVIERISTVVLATQAVFRPILVAPLDPVLAVSIPELPGLATLATAQVLQACMNDGWARRPPSILRFLSLLPMDEFVDRIRLKLQTPPAPSTDDPDLAPILSTNSPFLDRTKLRAKLKTLANVGAAKPILIVTGDSRSGKSYSADYVDDFCLRRSHISVCRQRLFPGTGWPSCGDVARDIVACMGRLSTNMPMQNTNADRWPLELANWVLVEAAQTPFIWWFVFDGFDSPNVTKDSRAFINFLADRITTGIFSRKYRVILLGYERGSLTVQPGKIDIDQIDLIQDDEIKNCVEHILKGAGVTAPPEQFLRAILEDLPRDLQRHEEINRRLCELMETVQR